VTWWIDVWWNPKRTLQLRSRSWAQGQVKESDIANGDPFTRGARTLEGLQLRGGYPQHKGRA
jgi:hypothetical protein